MNGTPLKVAKAGEAPAREIPAQVEKGRGVPGEARGVPGRVRVWRRVHVYPATFLLRLLMLMCGFAAVSCSSVGAVAVFALGMPVVIGLTGFALTLLFCAFAVVLDEYAAKPVTEGRA